MLLTYCARCEWLFVSAEAHSSMPICRLCLKDMKCYPWKTWNTYHWFLAIGQIIDVIDRQQDPETIAYLRENIDYYESRIRQTEPNQEWTREAAFKEWVEQHRDLGRYTQESGPDVMNISALFKRIRASI